MRATAEAEAAQGRGEHDKANQQQVLAASYQALHDAYRQREAMFAAIMSDRADWEQATRQQRHLALAADTQLRRRHPDQQYPPLRSAEPEPATQAQREDANSWLSEDDREFLNITLAKMRDAYTDLKFVLPQGVIHGDASVGNVLRDSQGKPVLIDLDGFAVGPREWDLVLTAIYYDSFGWHTREEYDEFARAYGFDIMQWPGYQAMRSVREFLMVTWLIQKAAENDQAAVEARKRTWALRTGASRKDWQPY